MFLFQQRCFLILFAAKAFDMIIKDPSEIIICDYELDEMRTVFNRKFQSKLPALDSFIANLVGTVNIVKKCRKVPANTISEMLMMSQF